MVMGYVKHSGAGIIINDIQNIIFLLLDGDMSLALPLPLT
jgi:hypothetical protein